MKKNRGSAIANQDVTPLSIGSKLGANSKDQWEVHFPSTAQGYDDDAAGAFLPRPGKMRAQPHMKVNECDH
jgi:hypothetical protein